MCNMRCKFCYQGGFASTRISDDILYNKLLPVLQKTKLIYLAGGEITIIPGMKEYIVFLRKRFPNISILISTNGLLLDLEWAKFLVDNNVLVNYSLNASNAENYKYKVYNVNYETNYKIIYENLCTALRYQNDTGERIINFISTVVDDDSLDDIEKLAILGLKLGVNVYYRFNNGRIELSQNVIEKEYDIFLLKYFCEEFIDIDLQFSPNIRNKETIMSSIRSNYINKVKKHIFLKQLGFSPKKSTKKIIYCMESHIDDDGSYCPALGNMLSITPNGLVCLCGYTPNGIAGDLNHQSIEEIFEQQIVQDMIKSIKSGNYQYCFERCPYVKNPNLCDKGASFSV